MSKTIVSWIITGLIILGIIGVWILTIQEGDRILNRGKHKYQEPVPYYSKQHGEDESTNP